MKYLVLLVILSFSKLSFGQISDTLALNFNQYYCGEAFFNITYYFNTSDSIVFHIDFGNNTDTTLATDGYFEYHYPYNDFSSTYVYSGNYTVEITAETNSGTFLDHKTYNFAIVGGEGCSQETIYKRNNDFSNLYNNTTDTIPIDFIGNDGITHTIFPTINTTTYPTNPFLYPAQINVNPTWLAANSMIQLNPSLHFSAPGMIAPEDMHLGLGWPVMIVSRTDIPNQNNSMALSSNSIYVHDQHMTSCYLNLNNTIDAIPDSTNRIRVEYDPVLIVSHDTLLNMAEGSGFIEFDVEKLNLYQSIHFGLTTNGIQSLDSIYFRCFYVNNSDQNALDDTTSLFLYSVDPCEGMTDSILNVSLTSSLDKIGSTLTSYLTLSKNICQEVNSIGLTVHHSPLLELENTNTAFQLTPINDSTLHGYLTIPQYTANQSLILPFTLNAIPPEGISVNYSIDLQDENLSDNSTGDTIHFAPCDSTDFALSALSAVMTAPIQAGSCSISPIILSSCVLADSTELLITFPSYVTMDSSALLLGTFIDSTLHILIDWSNQNEYFYIGFHIPGTIPSGTPYTISAEIATNYDTDTSNNKLTYQGLVLNSYDPNEKHADHPSNLDPNIQEKITYTIHFQNDGNLEAYNIVVRDTLSTNLDLSTFQFLGASHHCEVVLDSTTREVVFNFPNIMLPSSELDSLGSQGIFSYRVSENSNLPIGSAIENTAYIYFDFNPPIITNTTHNINELPLSLSDNKIESISLYPNPAQDKVRFSGAEVQKVTIYDMAGKSVLETAHIPDNEVSLNHLQTGIYQVVLATENGVSTQKLVIRK